MSRVPEKENISEVKIFVIHYNTESIHYGIYSELQNTHGFVYNTFLTIFQGSGIWLYHFYFSVRVRVMVFNATFNNI
jgi:hypothetical protein